ncbi:MAG TPA: XrtB/PEP-CTERM-associated polysaccharide biosynthesis outer membrane protein EpsL [Burkholderiales bacterium]|nr:XrtB/PEP-CTERM-associated polysaccharide biosynthesis outer membrane protein EpsL [Burkholderiales bacterium]
MLLVGGMAPVADADALWGDRLELFVSEAVTHDDNVFRISSQSDPAAVLGSPGDTYRTTSFGFNLDVPVSRQRFTGGLTLNNTNYDRFTVLNFDGHDGRAIWQWQIGNQLSGELGYTETLALSSLANIQGDVQSSTPNPLKTQRTFFNAAYTLTPRWRLQGEVSRLEQSNEVFEFQVNDIGIDGTDLTASYFTPANNQVGLNMRVEEARFPNSQTVGTIVIDNAYRQYRVAAITDLTLTGRSHVSARAGWISRSHDQLPERDFTGSIFHAAYDWMATGKLTLSAIAQRDVSATEQVNTSFVLVKGAALRPSLRPTEKVRLSGAYEYSEREYRGDPGQVVSTVPPRTDQVRSAGLAVSYRPVRSVTLEMAVRRETRSSTFVSGDYKAEIFSVSARLGF